MTNVLDPSKPLPKAEFYQMIHEQLSHEDSSMNQRVNWLIISQSFFFSAFATLLSSPPDPKDGSYAVIHDLLLWAIPGISLITTSVIYVGVLVSIFYMGDLRQRFDTYPQDDTVTYFPPIQSTPLMRRLAQLPAITVPVLFIGVWVFLIIKEI
jgi:hypothetical protein